MASNTYYKKVGRKYIPIEYYEMEGYPEGLYLFYKTDISKGMMSALHYVKLYGITNLGKWSDLWLNYGEELNDKIAKEIDEFIKREGKYSIQDLSSIVLKVLSDVQD